MKPADERRHFSRVHFATQAQVISVDERLEAQLLDISLQGALVQLPEGAALQAGEPCLLALRLGDITLKMGAEVAHVQDGTAGLQCRTIDLESISHLRRLVEVNVGDPKLLERDLKSLVAL
ncbi:PilZ domain-containing protein [Inhella gelatinilytica]|uniref:Cyclic diguanosine monophosphate-binding protein n=1 Tax=Inhella gelatinilytica TaxID=2795030 RepID=A0A931ISM4_9BURK|nr:PilZ domain-containing protein [Inhella gelatinilytica]MBH9551262.1 PilZ domain-containing protein [Inhella gelatinilytica]